MSGLYSTASTDCSFLLITVRIMVDAIWDRVDREIGIKT